MTAPAQALDPVACFGAVMHERHVGAGNRFVYPLAFMRVPLSRLGRLKVPLMGIDRPGLLSFRSADHGARDGSALLPWIRTLLERHDLHEVADGEVVLHAMPRTLGYVFNPVSFWYCHDRQGALKVVLAEVSNTFGERHNYLIHHPDHRPICNADELVARKVFHVSPFFPVVGEYRFRFEWRDDLHAVVIDYYDQGVKQLSTRVGGKAVPLDGAATTRWLMHFPLMTLGVIVRIHWQAIRLWFKKARFHRKPPPPVEDTTA